jgi:hypothetical protein
MTPFCLEKWYCDVLAADGTLLIVMLGRVRLAGLPWARLAVELHRPDGGGARDAATLRRFRRTADGAAFVGGELRPTLVRWTGPGIAGTVHLTPRFGPCTPGDPLLAIGRSALRWSVEVPDADAAVELSWRGGRLAVRGRAYCDRVLLDAMPRRLGLRRLTWGHAASPLGAAWWLELVTRRRRIAATWRDGLLVDGCAPPGLEPARTLVDRRVADLPILQIPPLGAVVRWLAGNPRQQRWLARVPGPQPAWAVHELVRWREKP